MVIPVTELGCIGHFILADKCSWRRHTQVGTKYRVSSVGDLWLDERKGRQTVGGGANDFYETMVFETTDQPCSDTGCGCLHVKAFEGIECSRYATIAEAQAGHELLVAKYRRLAAGIMR